MQYCLNSSEVVLFRDVAKRKGFSDGCVEITLTNYNLIFLETTGDIINEEVCPVENIKVYKGIPWIKQNGHNVEIYLTTGEHYFTFESRVTINKFLTAVNELVTGKTRTEKAAEKFKKGVNLVDDTLEISTLDTIKKAISKKIDSIGQSKNSVIGLLSGKKK